MPSTYSTRSRLLKQATGEGTNVWGDLENSGVTDLVDFAMDGRVPLTITGNVTLTSANGAPDQARGRVLDLTGSVGATITIPALEKWYLVINDTSADQIIASSGGGTTQTVKAGEHLFVYCDAANVKRLAVTQMANALDMGSHKITSVTDPTNPQDAATKAYADALAFASFAGTFPAMSGNAGKVIQTDGSVAFWHQLAIADLSDYASDQAAKVAAAKAFSIAMAIAL